MKKTLKEFRQMVADAKAAWLLTKKEKKAEADQKAALSEYQAKLALLDGFEADGKKDADEVEIPDDAKATNVIEIAELEAMLVKSVETVLAAKLPDALKGQVTEDGIKAIVETALKKHKITGEKTPTEAEIKAVLSEVVDAQMKTLKMPSKIKHATEDADPTPGAEDGPDATEKKHMIEVPFALTKGNLPLHFKQLLNVLLRKPMNEGIDAKHVQRGERLGDNMFLAMKTLGLKALTTGGSGTGAEWVPRDLGSELLRRLYLESQIAQVMMANEIEMPTDPFDLPLATTRPTFYLNSTQNTATTASDPGTAKPTLTTKKLMAQVNYSYEMNEDAIIPLLPLLQTLLGEAAAEALERAIINGDTTATHQDSDTHALGATAAEKAWLGWRKLALTVAALKLDMSTGGINRANLIAMKKKLGKWGRRPGDLIWVMGTQAENDFLGLDDVVTADKRGSAGTTITGTLNSYLGVPMAVSEAAREDTNATGVYDGTTTTKGTLILVNHRQFMLGNRRSFMLEVDRDITTQTNKIVASFRKAFQPVETPSASIKTVVCGYNYTA